jgi:hypothetical protein
VADWRIVAAELRAFDGRREVVKAMRKGLREPLPAIRKTIRARALTTLPARGGLGRWVAAARVNASIKINSRRVSMLLRGGRNSAGGRSDMAAIDRGRVRAPSWGHRTRSSWHTVRVAPGYFREPAAAAADTVNGAIDRAVDGALDQLRR